MRHIRSVIALLAALSASCAEGGEFLYGESVADLELRLHSPDVGVYPDTSVLDDENNPFAAVLVGDDTRWQIETQAGHVVAFYSWATLSARRPSGETQFYTAKNLAGVYKTGAAAQGDLPTVRLLAIRGFQALLDYFPDSVTYDATGTITYDLATPALEGILDLGGIVSGGWILVETSGGGKRAVQP